MLGDQDAGSSGLFVDFFGRPASTHKSICLLALEYQALICVGYARRLRLDNAVEQIVFRNKPEVVRALCSGRPVILLSGHFGNWEMAISIFGLFGFRMGLVARELDNPHLNRWFRRFRKYTGHRPIPKSGGGGAMVTLL